MGASDVHVTVGIPPKCRVNGELVTLMEGRISGAAKDSDEVEFSTTPASN